MSKVAENNPPPPNLPTRILRYTADTAGRDSFHDDHQDLVANGNAGRLFACQSHGADSDVDVVHSSAKGEVTAMRRTRTTQPTLSTDPWASSEDAKGPLEAETERTRPQVRTTRPHISFAGKANLREAVNQATAQPKSTPAENTVTYKDIPA
jgi:hypothetical protein